jgi:hypothetical protein
MLVREKCLALSSIEKYKNPILSLFWPDDNTNHRHRAATEVTTSGSAGGQLPITPCPCSKETRDSTSQRPRIPLTHLDRNRRRCTAARILNNRPYFLARIIKMRILLVAEFQANSTRYLNLQSSFTHLFLDVFILIWL